MPGSPFQSDAVSEEVLSAMEEEYGLHEPLLKQYGVYMSHIIQGDFGISLKKPGVRVNEIIARTLPKTFLLGGIALFISLVFGILLGMLQGMATGRLLRGLTAFVTAIGMGVPNFIAAMVLQLFFGVAWKLFPIVGLGSPFHFILPIASLSLYPTAVIARLLQGSFRQIREREFIIFARGKGLSEKQIIFRHILRNALIPVVTGIGPLAAYLLTGSFAIESIFTISGLGREFVNAIANRDYTVILGLTVFMGFVVVIIHIVSDIICAFLDPRIRLGRGREE